MKRTVRIVYNKLLNDNLEPAIGGVQTYIQCLIDFLHEYGITDIVVYQASTKRFDTIYNGYRVVGTEKDEIGKQIIGFIEKNENPDYKNDILIFATDFLVSKNQFKNSIAIQHGIAFDGTTDYHVSDLKNYICMIKNVFRTALKYHRFKNCTNIVCVDYNFLNWYRTQVKHIDANCYVIPNFSRVMSGEKKHNSNEISLIFARRMEIYRGTRIFTEAIIPLLKKYDNLKVTVAGTGPDEKWVKDHLGRFSNVSFITYAAEDSLEIHSRHDIAVVPTKYSEGTSLSLLEAMAAECAVICTNVGGMTNIVLDGFNGLMIRPLSNELENAIEKLILEYDYRDRLANNARVTVETSFSYEKWKGSWKRVLDEVLKK